MGCRHEDNFRAKGVTGAEEREILNQARNSHRMENQHTRDLDQIP